MCCSAKTFIDFMVYKRATALPCPSKPRKIILKLSLSIFPLILHSPNYSKQPLYSHLPRQSRDKMLPIPLPLFYCTVGVFAAAGQAWPAQLSQSQWDKWQNAVWMVAAKEEKPAEGRTSICGDTWQAPLCETQLHPLLDIITGSCLSLLGAVFLAITIAMDG